jgi:anti-sigma-K factor RskA
MFAWNASYKKRTGPCKASSRDSRSRTRYKARERPKEVRGEVVRLGDERAVLVAEDLPSPPEGETYEAWILREDVPEPAGLFEPNDTGAAAAPLEGSIEGADAVAVTVEPSGGSSSPTSDPLMTANV